MTEENQNLDPNIDPTRHHSDRAALNSHPAYQELLTHYQKAEWEQCGPLLDELQAQFPEDPDLLQLREDIEVKQLFQNREMMSAKRKSRRGWLNLIIIVLVVAFGIMAGISGSRWIASKVTATPPPATATPEPDQAALMLQSLEAQTQNLLQVGNSQMALETIQKIETFDPSYPALPELKARANLLVELDSIYASAMQKVEAGAYTEALPLFKQIEAKDPLYKDVKNQIALIEKRNSIGDLLVAAEAAYGEKRWEDVITAYEQVLEIDPDVEAPNLEEQLFMSYYNQINQILTNEGSTVEDINKADVYYRRAVSLVPQNKAFAQERRDLQQFLVGLLVIKYRQTAKMIVESPGVTEEALNNAVTYYRKALNLAPSDAKINAELDKAQIYLQGLQKFNRMEWDAAILNLEKLVKFQGGYAGGMIQQMLYEAYAARGRRFLSAGYFLDAQGDFEKAEIYAWELKTNKLQLYESQINMALALGKMMKYQNAVSYFNYALDTANVYNLVRDLQTQQELLDARALADSGQYYMAFTTYENALPKVTEIYAYKEVNAARGESLSSIAKVYNSTILAIREKNDLPEMMTIKSDKTLLIPFLP